MLLSISTYPVVFSAVDAPIWEGGAGFDEQLTIFDWARNGDWTAGGYGIKRIACDLTARAYASTGTVSTDFEGVLKVTWPDSVRPGQQDVPVTLSLGSLSGAMNGVMGAGIDVPLHASLTYSFGWPVDLSGTKEFTINLEEVAAAIGIPVPNDVSLNTSGPISPWFDVESSVAGSTTLVDASYDLVHLGTFAPGVGAAFTAIDPFLDANLGVKLNLHRTDHFTPSGLSGSILVNGIPSARFDLAGISQTVYVDIPTTASSRVSMDVANLSLSNTFHSSFDLSLDPYFRARVNVPIPWAPDVHAEICRFEFPNATVPLLALPPATLAFAITDPAPSSVVVENAYASRTIPAVGSVVQAENFNDGGEGVAYHDTTTKNDGRQYRTTVGVDISTCNDTNGGYCVNKFARGEYLDYYIRVPTAGVYDCDFRGRSSSGGGVIGLEVNGIAQADNTIVVPASGGAWGTITTPAVRLPAGVVHLRVACRAAGTDGSAGSFNWLKLRPSVRGNHDPNDQFTEAGAIQVGSKAGSIDSSMDVDLYRFTVAPKQRLRFSAGASDLFAGWKAPKGLPYLRLFNSAGQELARSSSLLGQFVYEFAQGGTYYVGVSGPGNNTYNPRTGALDRYGGLYVKYTLSMALVTK
jgi:hypothetical protein